MMSCLLILDNNYIEPKGRVKRNLGIVAIGRLICYRSDQCKYNVVELIYVTLTNGDLIGTKPVVDLSQVGEQLRTRH